MNTFLVLAIVSSFVTVFSDGQQTCNIKNEESTNENCPQRTQDLDCTPFDPRGPTVVFRDSGGRLGNWMSLYQQLLAMQIRFGVRPYLSRKVRRGLGKYFAGLEIEAGEERLCGLDETLKKFNADLRERRMSRILDLAEERLGFRPELERDELGRWSVPEELMRETGVDFRRLIHSPGFSDLGDLSLPPPPSGTSPPLHPWEVLPSHRRESELAHAHMNQGRAFILYPEGHAPLLNESEYLITAPNLPTRLEKSFQFHPRHQESARNTLKSITKHHLERQSKKSSKSKKKKTKKKPLLYVGIHVRRTDHEHLEQEQGLEALKPSYYLQAMDLFREFYKKSSVIFVLIGDDVSWARENLERRVKQRDLFFAGEGKADQTESIGHDLSLMSLCNHTIVSHGTFSYWSGFLAAGAVVTPMHFPQYRSAGNTNEFFKRHPLEHPLPRLYTSPI